MGTEKETARPVWLLLSHTSMSGEEVVDGSSVPAFPGIVLTEHSKKQLSTGKNLAGPLMLRFTILDTWRWHAGMFPEIETIALYVDHGKKQSVALKYHLGISKMLVFLGFVAKLLVKMVNFAVVFFFFPTSDLHLLTLIWTKRHCVKHWVVKKKGKTIAYLAWLIQAEKCSFRILQYFSHVCNTFLCKQNFCFKSILFLIVYFAHFCQNCSKSCLAGVILPHVSAGVADHKEITALHFSVNA